MLTQRAPYRTDDQVVHAHLLPLILEQLVQASPSLYRSNHVHFDSEEEMRHRPQRLRQPASDGLPHLGERDFLVRRLIRVPRGIEVQVGGHRSPLSRLLHVPLHDPPAWTRASNRRELHPRIPGKPPGKGRRLEPLLITQRAVGRRRWRRGAHPASPLGRGPATLFHLMVRL